MIIVMVLLDDDERDGMLEMHDGLTLRNVLIVETKR